MNEELISRKAAKAAGLTHYFTGKQCNHGHVSVRYVASSACKACDNRRSQSYAKENLDSVQRYKREYMKGHRQTVSGVASRIFDSAVRRAKLSGLPFDLTREWAKERVEAGLCEVTNIRFNLDDNDGARNPWKPSIDRIDSARGYTKDNCQMVATIYNYAKNEFTDDEVLVLANALVKKQQSLGGGSAV